HQARGELVEKHLRGTARQQVSAVRAAVVAERRRIGDTLREERRPDGHATAERLAGGDDVRLQPERRGVERHSGPAEAALYFVGDEERAAALARLRNRRRHLLTERPDAAF